MGVVRVRADTLRDLIAGGYTRAEAAAELGVSLRMLRRLCRRAGVRFRSGGRVNPDLRLAVLDAVRCGAVTGSAVARRLGRSNEMVSRWVRELVAAGALVRTGRARATRLRLAGEWAAARPAERPVKAWGLCPLR